MPLPAPTWISAHPGVSTPDGFFRATKVVMGCVERVVKHGSTKQSRGDDEERSLALRVSAWAVPLGDGMMALAMDCGVTLKGGLWVALFI
jgi:hypothetical protein